MNTLLKQIPFSFRLWLILAGLSSMLAILIYASVQQDYRMSANDPQIQIAEDAAANLGAGTMPEAVVPKNLIDPSQSLSPFVIVFDSSGQAVASSADLAGQTPVLPSGVFDSVKKSGEDRLTWQPQPGVRLAAVVVKYSGPASGFVLAARSLREVEIRERNLGIMTLLAWLTAVGGSLLACLLFFKQKKNP